MVNDCGQRSAHVTRLNVRSEFDGITNIGRETLSCIVQCAMLSRYVSKWRKGSFLSHIFCCSPTIGAVDVAV